MVYYWYTGSAQRCKCGRLTFSQIWLDVVRGELKMRKCESDKV